LLSSLLVQLLVVGQQFRQTVLLGTVLTGITSVLVNSTNRDAVSVNSTNRDDNHLGKGLGKGLRKG
jgi:hypothetical protein